MLIRSCSAVVLCLGVSLVVPPPSAAQSILVPVASSCPHCRAAGRLCTCTTWQPVVETRLRAEPALTVRAEPRLGYRSEAQLTSTPVTTVRSVIVDEGQYQTVWVPRPVTRQIAETTWQPQVSYRSVPFVYSEPVAQLSTRLVPEQTLRYVPHTQLVRGGVVYVPQTVVAIPIASPAAALAGSLPPAVQAAGAGAPIPDPAFARAGGGSEWTTISSRPASGVISPVSLSSGLEYDPLPVQSPGPQASVKAPSAAVVWQTPAR
ncbi:MAG TPA: hypothetical protein VML55_17075 [Planctomycetaceae bacterium]|nr:hypothetical protein [Planctomycetaceae bacterium]